MRRAGKGGNTLTGWTAVETTRYEIASQARRISSTTLTGHSMPHRYSSWREILNRPLIVLRPR